MRLQIQAIEMNFLSRVAGLSFRDMVQISDFRNSEGPQSRADASSHWKELELSLFWFTSCRFPSRCPNSHWNTYTGNSCRVRLCKNLCKQWIILLLVVWLFLFLLTTALTVFQLMFRSCWCSCSPSILIKSLTMWFLVQIISYPVQTFCSGGAQLALNKQWSCTTSVCKNCIKLFLYLQCAT